MVNRLEYEGAPDPGPPGSPGLFFCAFGGLTLLLNLLLLWGTVAVRNPFAAFFLIVLEITVTIGLMVGGIQQAAHLRETCGYPVFGTVAIAIVMPLLGTGVYFMGFALLG